MTGPIVDYMVLIRAFLRKKLSIVEFRDRDVKNLAVCMALLLWILGGSVANSATLRVNFSGSIDLSPFGGPVSEAFSGSFLYETTLAPSLTQPFTGWIGLDCAQHPACENYGPISSIQFSLGGQPLSASAGGLEVWNDGGLQENLDSFGFGTPRDSIVSGTVLGRSILAFGTRLIDEDGLMFDDLGVPTTDVFFNQVESRMFSLAFGPTPEELANPLFIGFAPLYGETTFFAITPVPLPSTLLLFLPGVGLVILLVKGQSFT